MAICYLGLGSNLNFPKRQLRLAISALHKLKNSSILKISNFYFNKPMGVKAQPMFYNLVIAMQTSLPPHHILMYCQEIEKNQSRIRKKKWGARTIDIDILLYGDFNIKTKNLEIPHPYMLDREFVLLPLLEISPHIKLPCEDDEII